MAQATVPTHMILPDAIIDSVKASIENTYPVFFSEKPVPQGDTEDCHEGTCIAGIISFVGMIPWSLSWIMTKETAPQLAKKFSGFEIPFESSDMGDIAGELVNVIAGEVIYQMEQRDIKVEMSLPTVARGNPLELVPESGPSIVYLSYNSKEGKFWFRLAASKHYANRLSGA